MLIPRFKENDNTGSLPARASRASHCAMLMIIAALFGLSAQAQTAPETTRRPNGNPLWEVAVSALRETRARPVFSASRRPPAPPVVAAPPPQPRPKPAAASEPDRLRLSLLGTVTGTSQRIGIFVDEVSNNVIRIKTGENHAGWILRSVERRAANFAKDRQETTLVLSVPGAEQTALDAAAASSRTGSAGVNRNAGDAPKNHALPAAAVIPVSAPTPRSAHKIRQDILSIGASD